MYYDFITCYHGAREEGFTERVIRAGWGAARLCSFNVEKVLQSSQIWHPPTTPPRREQPQKGGDSVFKTPQGPAGMYRNTELLKRSEKLSRSTRIVLQKAYKGLSSANTRAAKGELVKRRLQ